MKIEKLNGKDKRLYMLIAPLTMDTSVIRKNGGYPFTTSQEHIWYVAIDKKKVIGFLSVKGNSIVNDFSFGNLGVLKSLLLEAMTDLKAKEKVLKYTASRSELKTLQELGFIVEKETVNYAQMMYEYKEAL
jgi:hypothetical protein